MVEMSSSFSLISSRSLGYSSNRSAKPKGQNTWRSDSHGSTHAYTNTQTLTNVSDEVLWPVTRVHKVLTVVIVRVQTLGTLRMNKLRDNKRDKKS